jgi:hypothetical protein
LHEITMMKSNLGRSESSTILSVGELCYNEMEQGNWLEWELQMKHEMHEFLDGLEASKRSSEKIDAMTTTNMNKISQLYLAFFTVFYEPKPILRLSKTWKMP